VRALVCAYSLSLRNVEEMMAERGIEVAHSSVHRLVIELVLLSEKAVRRHKRPVGKRWRMDETYGTPSQRSPPAWG
jgi:transposase-like protein